MANMKDIKRRIKSVESTMQITKAMQLVASSKLKKAKEKSEKAKPLFDTVYKTMLSIFTANRDFSSDFTKKREVKRTGVVLIAGDRGLAGGYNSNIFKLFVQEMGEKDALLLPIGQKAEAFCEKMGLEKIFSDYAAEGFDYSDAKAISDKLVELYQSRKLDEIYIGYTQFVSPLTQTPQLLKLLPLELNSERAEAVSQLTEYDPSPEAVFASLIPIYLSGIIFGGVMESFASEQSARRNAMESATDNAEEMISGLSLKYNRARQAAITQEITEIVAGANA